MTTRMIFAGAEFRLQGSEILKRLMRLGAAALVAAFWGTGVASAQSNEMRTVSVAIPGGQGEITRRDTIFGRQSIAYQVRAEAGQTMAIALYPSNTATYFTVFGPGQAPGGGGMAGSDTLGPMVPELNRFRTRLSASGTYTILVYLYRAAARRGERSDFALDISLSAREYATQLPEPPGFRPPQRPGGSSTMRVTGLRPGDTLNVRSGPATSFRVIDRLAEGEVVRNHGCTVNATGQRWCEINPLGQPARRGWASASYLVAGGGGFPTRPPAVPSPPAGGVSAMLSNCQFEAASRLGGAVGNASVTYEGQRADGTHAVNGTIRLGNRTANFQCSFAADRVTIVNFWTNAGQAQRPPRPPSGPMTRTKRVSFPPGNTGTELTDSLIPGGSIRYVLGARNGQFLYVRVAARGSNIYYQIFNPDGSFLLNQTRSGQEYRGQLWESGDHVIEVINRGNGASSYNVTFGIQ